jgi:hypothetical protein
MNEQIMDPTMIIQCERHKQATCPLDFESLPREATMYWGTMMAW